MDTRSRMIMFRYWWQVLLLLSFSTRAAAESNIVSIVNKMADDVSMTCFSADDTICNDRALHSGENLQWEFGSTFFGKTTYACHAVHAGQHVCWNAFNENDGEAICETTVQGVLLNYHRCYWHLNSYGLLTLHEGDWHTISAWGGPC